MTRGTWIWRNGKLIEKGGPKDIAPRVARSDLPCPMISTDTMTACEHVDGKFYDSKSAFRRVTKERGLVEVGNDTARFKRPQAPNRDKAIEQSIDKALARARG